MLNNSVCYFILKDMQPYQTVNDPGFRAMLSAFDPRYVPMDRKTLATNYIPKLYDRERERICSELCDVSNYALTTDIWTSRHNEAYTGITIHFVNATYQLKSYLLETLEFPEAHTASNMRNYKKYLRTGSCHKTKYRPLQQTMELTLWLCLRLYSGNGCHLSATLYNLQWR